MEIASHKWKTTIAIEEYNDYEQNAWRNELPAGTSPLSCTSKQRSTRQVPDGETCRIERVDKGDGTFEQLNKCKPKYRSEPVEDDWCTYTVRRWKKVEDATAKGDGMNPAWPTNVPGTDALPMLGAKRSGAKTEKFIVDFAKGKGSCAVPEATWRKLTDGQKVKIEVRATTGDLVCDTIKAK